MKIIKRLQIHLILHLFTKITVVYISTWQVIILTITKPFFEKYISFSKIVVGEKSIKNII